MVYFCCGVNRIGSVNRTSIAENMAATPPNLLGIERRMA